jgi:hypothetical protein
LLLLAPAVVLSLASCVSSICCCLPANGLYFDE